MADTPRYSYLGPAGTFTWEALTQVPDAEKGEWVSVNNVGEALDDVQQGRSDYAMIAIENSIEGGVSATQDALAVAPELRMVGEYMVPVRFVLATAPGTAMSGVTTVAAHAVAYAQCRTWLDESAEEEGPKQNMFKEIFADALKMPRRMQRLGWVHFFSWFGLFTMWVYTTSALATHHYGLSPTDTHSADFNEAGNLTGYLFGWYNAFALPFAFLLTPLAKRTSRKFVHFIALLSGGLGLLGLYFLPTDWLILSMLGISCQRRTALCRRYPQRCGLDRLFVGQRMLRFRLF